LLLNTIKQFPSTFAPSDHFPGDSDISLRDETPTQLCTDEEIDGVLDHLTQPEFRGTTRQVSRDTGMPG
jgi:hypothetical protein